MRNYDRYMLFVLTVKYAKEYWVSETYKITSKFNTSHSLHEIDIQSQRLAENVLNRASILLSDRIQSFCSNVQWIFELSQ